MIFTQIIKIALLCIVVGAASIPLGFGITDSPWVVWVGNALGSFLSAVFVVFVSNRITSESFKKRISKRRLGRNIVTIYDSGDKNPKIIKARVQIEKRGLRVFSLLCPIFPGVLISTAAVYMLGLNKRIYARWMFTGVVFVSGAYVFGYWYFFVKS